MCNGISHLKLRKKYFRGLQDKKFNIDSMRAYIRQKPELDKMLEHIIHKYINKRGVPKILDACCGIGHLSIHMHEKFPNAKFLGIDETSYLIKEAQKLSMDAENVQFKVADIYSLPKKYKKEFDISICWKTLTWFPCYEDALRALFAVTKKHIFISSLFYEGDIDFHIEVREHTKERGAKGVSSHHNIYSLPRFKRFVQSLGAKRMRIADFDIGIDLPRKDLNRMGTYTLSLKNGKRMQMSGALPMPWKIITIDL